MKCPLLSLIEYVSHQGEFTTTLDCLQADCAWWIDHVKQCAIQRIDYNLFVIGGELQRLNMLLDQKGRR